MDGMFAQRGLGGLVVHVHSRIDLSAEAAERQLEDSDTARWQHESEFLMLWELRLLFAFWGHSCFGIAATAMLPTRDVHAATGWKPEAA